MDEITLSIGQKIAVAGYLYEVIRGAGPFFTLQYKSPHQKEACPNPTKLKKKDTFSVGDLKIKVISNSGGLFYRVRVK